MGAYDLFSASFKRQAYETFSQMRATHPVYGHVGPNGRISWYITRYDDVVAVLKDNYHFCKDVRHAIPRRRSQAMHQRINENMLFADPPDHTRLRALVNQAFTPRRIQQMAPRIQAVADELLAKKTAVCHMDLIADLALPLPFIVICDMLGIPQADQADVQTWSQAIISPGGKGLSFRERRQKVKAFIDYLQALFADRQQRPQDDMITDLVQAEEAGQRLSAEELSSMVALLLVTGYETTVNLIGNGALALLQHPEQLALLQKTPELWETAVEELLRFDGPVETSTTRWVRRDVTFHGHEMKQGEIVRVVLASANRDETQFEQPQTLDLQRAENKHLAFGLGIHYCLGAPLARLEGIITLRTLFARCPNLRLAVPASELTWRPGVLFRGLELLPVAWGDGVME